ncbi:hypothetical protein [Aquibacillus sediminis]|uniref:hypothetical protein n=1 Tax=Aquibacillus sediminis TaxID=2574734 RepID=UPI0011086BEC|nr:hypothetical protein [Aquibacillus sediminis]
MTPIKNGIKLSVPHLGPMSIYIYDSEQDDINFPLSKLLKEDPINPTYHSNKLKQLTFLHRRGDVYLDTTKTINLNKTSYSKESFFLFEKGYVLASIKSAIDYYSKRRIENVPALRGIYGE